MSESKDFTLNCPEEITEIPEEQIIVTQNREFFDRYSFDTKEFLEGIKEEDTKIDETKFIPLREINLRDFPKRTCDYRCIKLLKRSYLGYFSDKLQNCFYTGFMATMKCLKCGMIIDSFPCLEKRIYYVDTKHCPYCLGIMSRPDQSEFSTMDIINKQLVKSKKRVIEFVIQFPAKERKYE